MFVPRLLSLPAETLWGAMPDVIRNALQQSRGRQICPGGLRIDLYVIGGPGSGRTVRRLENALLKVEGVERAEVNGALGTVFVGCDPGSVDLEKLVAVVESFDDGDSNSNDGEPGEDEDEEFDDDSLPSRRSSFPNTRSTASPTPPGATRAWASGSARAWSGRVWRSPGG